MPYRDSQHMLRLPLNLLPGLLSSKPESAYQPFPKVVYHSYILKPELFDAGSVRRHLDLSLNAYSIVDLLKKHYTPRKHSPHLDYFAISPEFLLEMFEHDIPIYRVSDASVQYALTGKKLGLEIRKHEDKLSDNVYSLRGLHFRVSDLLHRNEIVAVLRNADFPQIEVGEFFVDSNKLTSNISVVADLSKALVQATHLQEPLPSFSVGHDLPRIRMAHLELPEEVGSALQELFRSMLVDSHKVQIEGVHYDGEKLNFTYTLLNEPEVSSYEAHTLSSNA